ncbi:class I SAM-dependent methyltransferase [Nakamurella sp. A5-74]|uniref:Class I SAM-dependent methyltransferase n=1 Tax=Nakamurella sp. A5-74 TaxID=3158264 RepID=A0AAU8DWH8_9ACTN
MPAAEQERFESFVRSSDQSMWSTAALIMGIRGFGSPEARAAAAEVLRILDLETSSDLGPLDPDVVASQATASMIQVAALLGGEEQLWASQSDEALLAQGRASAQGAAQLARQGLMLPGLAEALGIVDHPRVLDVGTGVGAMAVFWAEQYPHIAVVGIDVLPRVLALAAANVSASTAGGRVILREQDVSTLDETDTYAFAWMPAPFIPEQALREGVRRVVDALVPGGWLTLGHGKFSGDPLEDALNRFKTISYGGTALDNDQASQLLLNGGLSEITSAPTPPGFPAFTIGRKAVKG